MKSSMKSRAVLVVVGSFMALVVGATSASATDYPSPAFSSTQVWPLGGCSVTISHSNGIISGTGYAYKPSPCTGTVRATAYGQTLTTVGGYPDYLPVSKTGAWASINASAKISGSVLNPSSVYSASATRRV